MKGFESCCWEAGVPQVNGSSAKRYQIPALLSLNEGVTLSLLFFLSPRVCAVVPWHEEQARTSLLGKRQKRKGGEDGCVTEMTRSS